MGCQFSIPDEKTVGIIVCPTLREDSDASFVGKDKQTSSQSWMDGQDNQS